MELLILVGWCIVAGIAASVASARGRGGCAWFILGFLIGPLAVLLALILPANLAEIEERKVRSGEYARCRHCEELARPNAVRCPHCHGDSPGLQGRGAW